MNTVAFEEAAVVAVVVAHNSARWLPHCLRALQGQLPVAVVDNASTDDSVEAARQGGASVIRNRRNEGYGRANNQGVAAAEKAKWVLIINPDAVMRSDGLSPLLTAAERNPGAAAIAPRLIEPDGRIFVHDQSVLSDVSPAEAEADDVSGDDRVVHFASGACLLVRRDAFLSVGGFDERIFLFYEDDDLCLRLRRAGFKIVQVYDAVVRHARGASSEPAPGRIFRSRWHQAWSRSYVCRKHGVSDHTLRALVRNGIKLIGVLPTLNRRRIERYAGSVAGAWATLRNRSALERESLQPNSLTVSHANVRCSRLVSGPLG